jgi:hypothetical protein
VVRWAWLVVAWVSSWTGEAGVAGGVAVLGIGEDGDGFAGGVGGEGESGFGGQGLEDGGELGGGIAGEVDDDGEAGGERRAGVQHGEQRVGLAGQDDGEFVAVELTGFGQDLIQAAEDVLAVVQDLTEQIDPGFTLDPRTSQNHFMATGHR